MATVPLCDPWFNYPFLRAKRPLLSSYFSLPRGRKHIIGAIKSDGDHSSTSQNCLPPLQPCNQTVAPALAPGNGHPPETCIPCPGIPDRVPCCSFRGSQESEAAGVHTQRLSRHSNLGRPRQEPGQPFQVFYKSKLKREPPWLYQFAKSVLYERGRHFAED